MKSGCTTGKRCYVRFNYLTHGICSKEAVFSELFSANYPSKKCISKGGKLVCWCSAAMCQDVNDIVKNQSVGYYNGLEENVKVIFQCLRDILGEDLTWSDEKFENYTASNVTIPTYAVVDETAGKLVSVDDCFRDENNVGCYLKFNHLRGRWCSEKDLGMEVYKLKEGAKSGCNIFKNFMACKCTKEDCPDIKKLLPIVLDYDDDYGDVNIALRGGHLSDFKAAQWCLEKLVENNDLTSWDGTFLDKKHEIPERVYIVGDQLEAPPLNPPRPSVTSALQTQGGSQDGLQYAEGSAAATPPPALKKDPIPTPAAVAAPSDTSPPTSASTMSFDIAAIVFCPILIHHIETHL